MAKSHKFDGKKFATFIKSQELDAGQLTQKYKSREKTWQGWLDGTTSVLKSTVVELVLAAHPELLPNHFDEGGSKLTYASQSPVSVPSIRGDWKVFLADVDIPNRLGIKCECKYAGRMNVRQNGYQVCGQGTLQTLNHPDTVFKLATEFEGWILDGGQKIHLYRFETRQDENQFISFGSAFLDMTTNERRAISGFYIIKANIQQPSDDSNHNMAFGNVNAVPEGSDFQDEAIESSYRDYIGSLAALTQPTA